MVVTVYKALSRPFPYNDEYQSVRGLVDCFECSRWNCFHIDINIFQDFDSFVQVDSEMALEFATQSGMVDTARENIYLSTLDSSRTFAIELHNPVAVVRLFAGL